MTKSFFLSFLTLTLCSSLAAFAKDSQTLVPVHQEVVRLESALRKGEKNSGKLRVRLAEIYFLLSRCTDAEKVLQDLKLKRARELMCSCSGQCTEDTDAGRTWELRRLLETGARWRDRRVQKLWRSVRHLPEARYWVSKHLRTVRDPSITRTRFTLEKSLESLEVTP